MTRRILQLFLGLCVITVFATAIDCGCAMAQSSERHAVEMGGASHCEETTKKSQDASKTNKDCCLGCQIQEAAIKSPFSSFNSISYQRDFSLDSHLTFIPSLSLRNIPQQDSEQTSLRTWRAHSQGIFKQVPLYLRLLTLLI